MATKWNQLLCRLFGHKPGYKVVNGYYAQYHKGKKITQHPRQKTVNACIRCGVEEKNWKKK